MRHVIYIPGLGDHFDPIRRLVLTGWRRSDTRITFVPMHWNSRRETYEEKYERIAKVVKNSKETEIILVGESAGGAMALFTFSRNLNAIDRVVTICGYNHGAADVHPYHKRKHPAFYQLMPNVDDAVEHFTRQTCERITTIYSTRDHVVTAEHSRIDHAKKIVLHTLGHFTSIATILLRGVRL